MTDKQALCVEKIDVWKIMMPVAGKAKVYDFSKEFWNLNARLVSRSICETDPTTLQIIPYIVVSGEGGEIVSYSRAKGGGEARLHAKRSIGFGGHMEVETLELLLVEASRELQEELHITADPSELTICGFIYDELTAVGKVHLGVLVHYDMTAVERQTMRSDPLEVEDLQFTNLNELLKEPAYEQLEYWSQAVVDFMLTNAAQNSLHNEGEKQ